MQLPFKVNIDDKVVVVTGGSGVLGAVLCKALAKSGAKVAILARNLEKINLIVNEIKAEGGIALGMSADVLNKEELELARVRIHEEFGKCSILINGAGGNHPNATTSKEKFSIGDIEDKEIQSFFDIESGAVEQLINLNFLGTLLPTQVFAQDMIGQEGSTIINISSMNAFSPLTKIPAYSGAKAAISNFTQWLAVHFSEVGIRVNAIAPGFFLTDQNRSLLLNADGSLSERANKILAQTPMKRFGEAQELVGTLLWLVDDKSSGFVNGIIVPIDGGFSAYSGV